MVPWLRGVATAAHEPRGLSSDVPATIREAAYLPLWWRVQSVTSVLVLTGGSGPRRFLSPSESLPLTQTRGEGPPRGSAHGSRRLPYRHGPPPDRGRPPPPRQAPRRTAHAHGAPAALPRVPAWRAPRGGARVCGAEGGAGAVTRSTAAERVRGSAGSDGAAGAVRPPVAGRAGRRAGAGPAALAAARYRPPRVRPQGRRPGARDAHAEQAQPAQRVRRAGELEGRRARWGGRGSRGAGGARAERERVGAALRRADLAPCPLLGRRGLPRGPGRGSGGGAGGTRPPAPGVGPEGSGRPRSSAQGGFAASRACEPGRPRRRRLRERRRVREAAVASPGPGCGGWERRLRGCPGRNAWCSPQDCAIWEELELRARFLLEKQEVSSFFSSRMVPRIWVNWWYWTDLKARWREWVF